MYTELSQEAQIEFLSGVVPEFLAQYELEKATFINVNHGFNSTFKVDASDGRSYALRINTNSQKNKDQVAGEVQLLELISENKVIEAPVPVRTASGEPYSKANINFLGREVTAILNHWIEGEDLGDEITDDELWQLGAAMAKLHQFSRKIPDNLVKVFPRIDRTLLNSPDNLRKDEPRFDSEIRKLIDKAFEATESIFTEIAEISTPMLIHADLHPSNVLKTKSGIAVIDFDDVGIGHGIQDLAITFFYLRDMPGKEDLVLEGYRSVAKPPHLNSKHIEALLLSRQLLLLNDLLDVTTAEEIAITPEYIEISKMRLKNFFDTGQFKLIRTLG